MTKLSLRSIFTAPLSFIHTVLKIKVNGFMGGIVIGALFSLVVNLITVQVQEAINKQRVLEAVEWEIFNNSSLASSVINEAGNIFKEGRTPSPYYSFRLYSMDLWKQSIEPMLYIAQLPSNIQAQVISYYTVLVKGHNDMIEINKKISETLLKDCYSIYGTVSELKMNECNTMYYQIVKNNLDTAEAMSDKSFRLLDVFHPTQDRLNNIFLRFMMGKDSVRVLSGR